MMAMVPESSWASTERDDGFQDISGVHVIGYISTRHRGGVVGRGAGEGAVGENQSLSAPNYSSARECSHFKWKLVFWLLLYPLDQSRSLLLPWKIRWLDSFS